VNLLKKKKEEGQNHGQKGLFVTAISAQPTIFLDKLQHKLATIFGVQVSLAMIS
jgi:hypothetical protein